MKENFGFHSNDSMWLIWWFFFFFAWTVRYGMEIHFRIVSMTYILLLCCGFDSNLLLSNKIIFIFVNCFPLTMLTILGFAANGVTIFVIFVIGITQRSARQNQRVSELVKCGVANPGNRLINFVLKKLSHKLMILWTLLR